MNPNPTWKDWFVFSKKERNAFVVLVSATVILILGQWFYQPSSEQPVIENLDQKIAGLSAPDLSNAGKNGTEDADRNDNVNAAATLFVFDPNTLDEAGFKQLGLRDKTIHTIINYRSKGGQFRKPEDLRKIYGLKPEEADRLIPFIQMASKTQNRYDQTSSFNSQTKFKDNHVKPEIIDINTASVEQWKALPLIGDALSNRIVKYRDKMGGFTSVEQVKKTYGLSDSAYQTILPYLRLSSQKGTGINANSSSKKININTASVNDFKANSSIPAEVAEAIIIYRKQHGNYSSVSDIKKIVFINEELYQKVSPYLMAE